MKQSLICLTLALLLPSVVAFSCNTLGGGDLFVCNSIQSNANISSTEKDLLISDIFNKNKTTPNFDFIYSWNTNLNIQNSPDGKTFSSGTINNAWIKIIALMPSIIEDNILYSYNYGKLLTAYNYNYKLPSQTEAGDCKTNYHLENKQDNLKIYLNNNLIGNTKLLSFIVNSNPDSLNFLAELNIKIDYSVDHYKSKTYCSAYDKKGNCVKYSTKCEFSNTEHRTDKLILFDTLNAQLYKSSINSSFQITNKYNNLTQGVLSANNFTKLILTFNNSYYENSKYTYSLNYTLPYYVLTFKAEKLENTNFNNIHVDKSNNRFLFTVQDASNCKIKLFDHFSSITKNCDLTFNDVEFSIKSDKNDYFENDTIKVKIVPDNIKFSLSYANQTKEAIGYAEFKAVLYENRINANLNNKEISWFVNVKKKENTIVFYNLCVLAFLGYFFYRTAKAYYPFLPK